MITCKELDTTFESKEQLFKALRQTKKDIIGLKKAQILKSYEKDSNITIKAKPIDFQKLSQATKNFSLNDDSYYIAVNSTRILDSHKDLHLDGIWNKSVKELQGKNYLVDTHTLSLATTIVRKEHIEMLTATIPFSLIGKGYSGETEALIYKFKKDKVINPLAKEWLDSGDDIEASVRMRYTDILLAMNSDDKEDEDERKNFETYYPVIANKQDFDEEIQYFWAVKQAQNQQESSLVLFGSNSSTGTFQDDLKYEQSEDTQKEEAALGTSVSDFYKLLKHSKNG